MLYSPLRYPGGKNKLSKFVSKICIDNKINSHYIEPFAGGGSVALYLLIEGYVEKITINDLDKSIYAFWYCVLNKTDEFCEKILSTEINIKNRRVQKDIQKNKEKSDLFDLGFSTFFLNRTNRSGIIKAGVIGGLSQSGDYKMDCRFNKSELIKRIRRISQLSDSITISNLDALELIQKTKIEENTSHTIFYFDPPYYVHGESLYVNHFMHEDHEKISSAIKNIEGAEWIVSYDNTPEIEKMFGEVWRPLKYSFTHTAYKPRKGKEILFFSKGLFLDNITNPLDIKLI